MTKPVLMCCSDDIIDQINTSIPNIKVNVNKKCFANLKKITLKNKKILGFLRYKNLAFLCVFY